MIEKVFREMSDFDKIRAAMMKKYYMPDNDVRFNVNCDGNLQVSFPYDGADLNLRRVFYIDKANARKLAEYLREVE